MLKRLFGRKRFKPSLRNLRLEVDGLKPESGHKGVRVWRTDAGDAVGMFYFNSPPDLPSGHDTDKEFLSAYCSSVQAQGVTVVELDICDIGNLQALKSIVKVPQEPTGMTYVGAFILPFREHSFVIKIQAEERGITGMREAILLDAAISEGKVRVAADGAIEGDWNPEDRCHDEAFPDHPLSRVRSWLPRIRSNLTFDANLESVSKFEWPGESAAKR